MAKIEVPLTTIAQMLVEHHVKQTLDIDSYKKTDMESRGRLADKMAITFCRKHSPKQRFNVDKAYVTRQVTDMFRIVESGFTLRDLYGVETRFDGIVCVQARSKTEADRLIRAYTIYVPEFRIGSMSTLGKVDGTYVKKEDGLRYASLNGKMIRFDPYVDTINILSGGVR